MVFTADEIYYLLSSIEPNRYTPGEIRNDIKRNIQNDLTRQLKNINNLSIEVKHRKKFLTQLKEEIEYHYHHAHMAPGAMPGVIAGQSIGQPVTQSTLNSFHYSGVASARAMVMGVKKFLEILNATHNPKSSSCTIHYPIEHSRTIRDLRECVGNTIVELKLGDVVFNHEIIYDLNTLPEEKRWWYSLHELIHPSTKNYYRWCIRVHLDLSKLYKYRVTPLDIVNKLEVYEDLNYIPSPLEEGIVDVFVKTSHLHLLDKFNSVNVNQSTREYVYFNSIVIPNLYQQQIAGIKNISKMYFAKDTKMERWYLETEGSNLKDLLYMSYDSRMDSTKPIFSTLESTDMWEIYNMLGIEAARVFLINEITKFIGFDGTYIDHHHIELLVDMMTWDGTISSVSRHGIDRGVGPLAKASFEESMENMLKAGMMNEVDSLSGVSASIIMGKRALIGTNNFTLLLDPKKCSDEDGGSVDIIEFMDTITAPSKDNESNTVESNTVESNTVESNKVDLQDYSLYFNNSNTQSVMNIRSKELRPYHGDMVTSKHNTIYVKDFRDTPSCTMSLNVIERYHQ